MPAVHDKTAGCGAGDLHEQRNADALPPVQLRAFRQPKRTGASVGVMRTSTSQSPNIVRART